MPCQNLCPACGKTFSSRYNLRAHALTHDDTSEARFVCDICNRIFVNKGYFRDHLNSHIGLREKCQCGAEFVNPSDLTRHKKVCDLTPVKGPAYKCNICKQNFTKCQTLIDHIKGKHKFLKIRVHMWQEISVALFFEETSRQVLLCKVTLVCIFFCILFGEACILLMHV